MLGIFQNIRYRAFVEQHFYPAEIVTQIIEVNTFEDILYRIDSCFVYGLQCVLCLILQNLYFLHSMYHA